MFDPFRLKHWVPAGLLLVAALALAPISHAAGDQGELSAPAQVRARYVIMFNGIELGDFNWDSMTKGNQYQLASTASLTALFGAYKWQGITRAAGSFGKGDVRPSSYGFKYDATDKNGQVAMRFNKGRISSVEALPVDDPSPESIPVQPSHMIGALDPLSAVMALSTPAGGRIGVASPCTRRVPVFDGKQRFDLVLSFGRKEQIQSDGANTFAFVCKVRYVPISGHKNNSDTRFMTDNKGIEIWLAPVDYANVYVPTNIVIPTWAGTVEIASRKVEINMTSATPLASN